jgi:penicillin amidase
VRNEPSLKIEVSETRNGPLLSHLVEQLQGPPPKGRAPAFALRWGLNSHGTALGGWLAMARARSIEDVAAAAALLDHGSLALNLVVGDKTGEVGHWGIGSVPVRDPLARFPVFGHRGEAKWSGVMPLSRSVARCNPDEGFVLSANEGHVAPNGASYPIHGYGDHPYRARRIRQVLEGQPSSDVGSCQQLQRDVLDLAAVDLLPYVKRALASPVANPSSALAAAAPLLAEWDGVATAESGAAAVCYLGLFTYALPELFPEPQYGPLAKHWRFAWFGAAKILAAPTSPWFADEAAKDAFLIRAFSRAADWLAERFGPDPAGWSWGEIHPCVPRHPLWFHESFAVGAPPGWSAPGSPFTVLQHRFSAPVPPFAVTIGPSVRMVADLAGDEVQLALPSGESGQVASPHLIDQISAWRNGQYLTLRLTSEIAGDTTELVSG